MNDDAELLRAFAENSSEEAFATLVERYLGLVYHAALRRVGGDRHRAQDVAQHVFTDLARKAQQLVGRPGLSGWLYTSTRYAASQILRSEQRRAKREQIAMTDESLATAPEDQDWAAIQPLIDDAIDALSEKDQRLILERFFNGKSFAEIGENFSLSEDGARMRTSRALEKLRDFFARKGVASTTAALSTALLTQSAVSAPAGMAALITATALTKAGAAGAAVAATLIFGMNKLNIGIITALLVGGVSTIAIQEQQKQKLHATVAEQSAQLSALASDNGDAAGAGGSQAEIARLRSRLATLEAAHGTASSSGKTEVAKTPVKNALAPGMVPIEKLAGAGLATPRAAFATQLWAAHGGDIDLEAQSITLGARAREQLIALAAQLPDNVRDQYNTPERLMAYLLAGSPHPVGGMAVLNETPQDADNVILHVQWQHEDSDQVNINDIHMRKSGDSWQMMVSAGLVERAAAYVQKR